MPTHLEWSTIAVRLALTAITSALIGLNRGEHHEAVGLRTTMLVALAAAIAMVQVNLLLPVTGKASDSFVVLDLMRLPLGILTGVGFIGAGAIVHRETLVQGVTTAATLWYVTVMGLCFGGGQIWLGLAGFAVGIVILWYLKWIEHYIPREHQADLVLAFEAGTVLEPDIALLLDKARFTVVSQSAAFKDRGERCVLRYDIRWPARGLPATAPAFIRELAHRPGIIELEWRPVMGG